MMMIKGLEIGGGDSGYDKRVKSGEGKKIIDIGKMIIMIMMTVMQRVLSDNANIFSAVSDFPHCDANE